MQQDHEGSTQRRPIDSVSALHTALIWIATAGGFFLVWHLRYFLLMAFAAVILALLLQLLASRIERLTGLGSRASFSFAILIVLVVIGMTTWRFGTMLAGQLSELASQVEGGAQSLEVLLHENGLGGLGSNLAAEGSSLLSGSVENFASTGIAFAESALVVIVSAAYLSAEPFLYRRGLARVLHPLLGSRVDRHIGTVGRALQLWLLAQLILMLLVAVLTLIAAWMIGLPNPLALALIAGIAEAVPYIGPFLSAVPALLIAITKGFLPAFWTAIAYVVIHILEGYLAAPLVDLYFITIPPAIVLGGIVVSDLVFGTAGIFLAAPMTVAAFMAARSLYGDEPDLK
ncbi:MAG: AI-2E family transporter [Hyphomicrobiaceae bacterium]